MSLLYLDEPLGVVPFARSRRRALPTFSLRHLPATYRPLIGHLSDTYRTLIGHLSDTYRTLIGHLSDTYEFPARSPHQTRRATVTRHRALSAPLAALLTGHLPDTYRTLTGHLPPSLRPTHPGGLDSHSSLGVIRALHALTRSRGQVSHRHITATSPPCHRHVTIWCKCHSQHHRPVTATSPRR